MIKKWKKDFWLCRKFLLSTGAIDHVFSIYEYILQFINYYFFALHYTEITMINIGL